MDIVELEIDTWRVRVANSTLMVDLDSRQNSLRVKRERMFKRQTPTYVSLPEKAQEIMVISNQDKEKLGTFNIAIKKILL